MNETIYQREWTRQRQRTDLPAGHIPVHRWYLRMDEPWQVEHAEASAEGLSIMRAHQPSIAFYRFLYHTAGEEFVWGDRRRMSDKQLSKLISNKAVHVMVLYRNGTPAGFYELHIDYPDYSEIKYFALLPGNIGHGLGSYLLNRAIVHGAQRRLPLIVDTCTLDHASALENYRKRGFEIYREEDEEYPDPRLDGTIPRHAGKHVPLAE
jgi:ribosomal protein S18 acetylase RimI-like enzyme